MFFSFPLRKPSVVLKDLKTWGNELKNASSHPWSLLELFFSVIEGEGAADEPMPGTSLASGDYEQEPTKLKKDASTKWVALSCFYVIILSGSTFKYGCNCAQWGNPCAALNVIFLSMFVQLSLPSNIAISVYNVIFLQCRPHLSGSLDFSNPG